MSSRGAILPHPIDPFLLEYWLWGFRNVWYGEVDKLYIVANSPIEKQVVEYVRQITKDDKIELIYVPNQIEHGAGISLALERVKEKHIVLLEDDCFIFRQGVVDQCFRWLEDDIYDIVGSKRGSCHPEILLKAQQIWGLSYEGEGDHGCNFWPNMVFMSKERLLATDGNYGARAWSRGEIIPPLNNHIVEHEQIHGDTFVWASLQLRANCKPSRIRYIPQNHGHPDDLKHEEAHKYIFDGHAGYVHIGSLSSGIHGLLKDPSGHPLAYRVSHPDMLGSPPPKNMTEMELFEFERRVQWWLTCVEFGDQSTIADFRMLYNDAVIRLIGEMQLSIKRIRSRQRAYKKIGLW